MATATLTLGSQNRWLADGTTTDWNFNFSGGYISTDHVFAYSMSNDTIPVRHDYVVTGGSFVSQYVLRITPAVPNGHTIVIYRDSRNNGLPLADFVDGGGINETDLDAIARQAIFVNQETLDSATTQFQTSQPALFDQFAQATLDQVNAIVGPTVSGLAAEVAARTAFQNDTGSSAAGKGGNLVGLAAVYGVARTVAAAFAGMCIVSADATGGVEVTSTIQAALDSGASQVILPLGTYLSGALTIPAGVTLRGQGWGTILKLKNAANAALLTAAGANSGLADIKLDGNGDAQNHSGSCTGLTLTNASTNARVSNVWAYQVCDWGFWIKGTGHKFDRCLSTDVRGAQDANSVRCGFLLNDGLSGHVCKDVVLTACEARDSTVPFTNGFILEDGGTPGGGFSKNITLQGCIARNNSYMGFKPKSDQTTLQGCHSSSNGVHGYQTQSAPQDLLLTVCTADNNGFSGYYLNPTSTTVTMRGLRIIGCTARNNGTDATGSTRYGFAFEATAGSVCDCATIMGCDAYDNQGAATQQRGYSWGTSGSFTNMTVVGNSAKGNTVDWLAGVSLDLATLTRSANLGFSSAGNTLNFTWPTNIQRLEYFVDNIAANATSLSFNSNGTTRGYIMTRAGCIRGVTIKGNAAITAGTLTVLLRINGTPNGTFNVVLNTTNPTINSSETNIRVGTFVKGDVITLTYSTDAGFLPTGTTDYDGVVEVMFQ